MDFRVIYQGEKIMLIVREFSNRFQQMSGMPINSNETKERLKAAGIDINSKQYRTVMSEMSRDGGGGYTTISAIKKRMSRYDKDGDWINHAQDWRGTSLQIKIVLAKIELFQFQKALWMRCLKALKKNFIWKMGCITAIQQTDQRYIKSCISKLRKTTD